MSAIQRSCWLPKNEEGLRRHRGCLLFMQNEEHSSGSRRHLIKVEEITNYQRGLVDNVSGKDADHGEQVEAGFTANRVLGSGKTRLISYKNGIQQHLRAGDMVKRDGAVTREAREWIIFVLRLGL